MPANYRRLCYEGKIYDFAYTADWLWQGAGEPDQRLTRDAILDRLMPDLREALGDTVSRGDEVALPFPGSPDAVPYDLRHDYAAAIAVPPGQSVTIPVGACLTGLTLRHATDRPLPRVMWADPTCIGQYRVSYADGSEWIIPIEDAADLCCYRGRYAAPLPSPLYRHEGYTATCLATPIRGKTVRGEDYTLYATARRNPDPTREIASITLERNEAGAASLLLFGVDAWKN